MRPPCTARLLVMLLVLTAAATAGERDPLCKFLDDVLKDAPNKFVALRGKRMEGHSPMWEGKLKAPGATSCEATETGYSCSLGARPVVARGRQEFLALTRKIAACYPGWKVMGKSPDPQSMTWNLRNGNTMISVEYVDMAAMGDEEAGSSGPELIVGVWVMKE